MTIYLVIYFLPNGRKSVMTAADLFQKRKRLFLGVLLLACFTFTADILDLREELRILSCPYSYLDSNVTTGMISSAASNPEPIPIAASGNRAASANISFFHLLPYGFRAPPATA